MINNELNQQINEAQNKLSDIMTAINRENLILEGRDSEKKQLNKEILDLENKVKDLNSTYDEKVKKLKELSDIGEAELLSLGKIKTSLNTEIETLRYNIKRDTESFESRKVILSENLDRISKEIDKETNDGKKEIGDIIQEKNILKDDVRSLTSQKTDLGLSIVGLNDKISESNILLTNNQIKIDEINQNISIKNDQLTTLNDSIVGENFKLDEIKKSIDEINIVINDLVEKKNVLELDIQSQEGEKEKFIKDKFDLVKMKDEVDKRERFIKGKYEQAGIAY